ncbi:MAG: hypothetical protein PVH41_02460 [Anaerolineae bacterium]|jgi:hypothetical protein
MVGNVALQGAPQVVTGTVTLAWDAGVEDKDALNYDIHYGSDGGATFQPVKIGVGGGNSQPSARRGSFRVLDGGSAEVDATQLSGSTSAVLRVVVSDGVHTDCDDTDPFVLEDKPPEPPILQPADGTQVHYGQLVPRRTRRRTWRSATRVMGRWIGLPRRMPRGWR